MNVNLSFPQLIQEIISIYDNLISEKTLSENGNSNYIVDSLNSLNCIKNINHFILDNLSYQEIFHFLKLLLDVIGLVYATEGTLQPVKLGDTKLIGRKRDLMGVYKGDDNSVDQNMCATLFQGWVKTSNSPFKISKDLRSVVPKNNQACDFLLEDKRNRILIECKRIHSLKEAKNNNDLVTSIVEKSIIRIRNSILQFESTAKFLNANSYNRFLVLDVSAYGKNCIRYLGDNSIVGLLESKEIKQIITDLQRYKIEGIDEIILCWSELYVFENKPRTFVFRTTPLKINKDTPSLFSYEGWTIEFYPLSKRTNEFKELRISAIARSQAWIKASWYSCTDNLIDFGPEETLENESKHY